MYVVPKHKRDDILEVMHKSVFSAHLGANKTFNKIKERFYWPRMQAAIEKYIRECDNCQKIKASIKSVAPMKPIEASRPLELVTTDITGPLPKTKRNNAYLLLIIDHFTKFLKMYLIKNMLESTVANQILNYIFNFGIMDNILSDQGTN